MRSRPPDDAVARNDLPFEAQLWTQHTGDSSEVFVYDVTIGEEEFVDREPVS